MKNDILLYIPSETKAAPRISMKRLLGVPQFLRPILTLSDTGEIHITVVVPISERRHVLKAWKRHTKGKEIKPHFIWTTTDHNINSRIFTDIIQNAAGKITIINANLLITKDVLKPWQHVHLNSGQHLKAVIDRGLPPLIRVVKSDLENAARLLDENQCPLEDLLEFLLKKTTTHPASSHWNEPVKLVTQFTQKSEATKFLTDKIRRDTPTWIARNINKRISLPISVFLARLRVSPNTITMFNMVIGMAASIGAAGRTYVGLLIGAIFFQLASIIDGCDGEVAKLTHRCSKFGQYIDSISDNLALAGFFTGLMIHVYRVNNHTPYAFVLGGAILLGFFTILGFMINFLKKNTDSASFVTFDKEFLQKLSANYPKPLLLFIKYGKYALKKDFFSLMFLVFAIFGVLPLAFYISAVACWVGVIILIYLNLRPLPRNAHPHHTLRNKKLVIFDFDGTLVDSMNGFADIAAKIMHQIYETPISTARRLYIETSGLPFFQQLEQIYPGNEHNSIAAKQFETEKLKDYYNKKIYPDAIKATKLLRDRGILTATSSNNFQDVVEEFIKKSGLKLDFTLGYKTESFCKGIPHFKHLMDCTGIGREEMLFVGDSLKDADKAADFDIDFIGKTGLFNEGEFKKHSPKSLVINDLNELTVIVE